MGASNLKLILISSTWEKKKKIFKSWQVCDLLAKWLIVLGFMDLRWPRVYRRSNVGLVDYVPIIVSREIFRSYYQWEKWRPCKRSRSKVKVTEVTTQLNRFRTVTPVWIHIWWWNDAYSLIMLRIMLPYCFSRSSVKSQGDTALKIVEFDPDWGFPDCNSSFNSPMVRKCCTKLEVT